MSQSSFAGYKTAIDRHNQLQMSAMSAQTRQKFSLAGPAEHKAYAEPCETWSSVFKKKHRFILYSRPIPNPIPLSNECVLLLPYLSRVRLTSFMLGSLLFALSIPAKVKLKLSHYKPSYLFSKIGYQPCPVGVK